MTREAEKTHAPPPPSSPLPYKTRSLVVCVVLSAHL